VFVYCTVPLLFTFCCCLVRDEPAVLCSSNNHQHWQRRTRLGRDVQQKTYLAVYSIADSLPRTCYWCFWESFAAGFCPVSCVFASPFPPCGVEKTVDKIRCADLRVLTYHMVERETIYCFRLSSACYVLVEGTVQYCIMMEPPPE
jgi:hypothetical protein